MERQIKGIPASPGIVVGHVHVLRWEVPDVRHRIIADEAIPDEIARLHAAIAHAKERLQLLRARVESTTGPEEAAIFDVQLSILDDRVEHLDVLGIFSTPATAASRVYEIEIDKRSGDVAVFSEACPTLARQIEAGAGDAELRESVNGHVATLTRRIGRPPDRAILGCTHYEIIAELFRAALPAGTPLIHQPDATADAIALYVRHHPEYEPGSNGLRRFLTTGTPGLQNGLVEQFWGAPLMFDAA